MKKLIKVTQEHIDKGTKFVNSCPVALASKPLLDANGIEVSVTDSGLDLWDRIKVPRSVKIFIHKFDLGKPVKPFNFIVNIPNAQI